MNDVAPGFCKMTAVDTPATANRTNAPMFTMNRPRGHVEDDGDPREEEVEVDRAHVRHRDNPPTGCEGRPEDGATQAEGDSPALQVPGPEGAARGRARVGEESRHGHGGIVLPTSIRLLAQRAPR